MAALATRAALLSLLWLALSGGSGLGFGALAVALSVAASFVLVPAGGPRPSAVGALRFAAYFLRESLSGGVDVARRAFALEPRELTRGTFISHHTQLPESARRSLLIATIGLLPGTVVAAVDGRELTIHVLDESLADRERIERLERRVGGLVHAPAASEPPKGPRGENDRDG